MKTIFLRLMPFLLFSTILIFAACDGNTEKNTPSTSATKTTSISTTTQQVTTPLTTTTPTTTSSTSQASITLTKTATLISTTPTEANHIKIREALQYLFVPEFKPVQELIPILLTVTNPEDSPWTCDIPITFTDLDDENIVVIWVINVTLDVGETKEILVWGITMGEGRWNVKVGFKTRIIFTS